MMNILEGFHQWEIRRIMGMKTKPVAGGEWRCTPVVAELEAARLQPIYDYMQRHQSTITVKVSFRTIYELFTKA